MSLPPDLPLPRRSRRRGIDGLLAFSVIVISLSSMFIALRQSRVMEQQLEASVWPYVEFDNSNYDGQRKEQAISLSIGNVGVGPARIVALAMRYENTPVTGWKSLFDACCNPEQRPVSNILSSGAIGRVLPAGGTISLFRLTRSPDDEAVWSKLNTARFRITGTICYCSVFDSCWTRDLRSDAAAPVANCQAIAALPQYRE